MSKIKQFILDFDEIKKEAVELWGENEHTGNYRERLECPDSKCGHNISSFHVDGEWESLKEDSKYCSKCGKELKLIREEIVYDDAWKYSLERLVTDDDFRKETMNKLK